MVKHAQYNPAAATSAPPTSSPAAPIPAPAIATPPQGLL